MACVQCRQIYGVGLSITADRIKNKKIKKISESAAFEEAYPRLRLSSQSKPMDRF
jgi:hypothetical protein